MKKIISMIFAVVFSFVVYSQAASAATHTIKENESLQSLAERYDTTIQTLMELNNFSTVDEAVKGTAVKLPDHIQNKIAVKSEKQAEPEMKVKKTLTVKASAYTPYCKGCSGFSATGINLRKDKSLKLIAVDPKVIPLGSKVWVEGYGIAIAGDTGGSIKGNKIDILVQDKATAYKWGRKTVTLKVLY